MSKAYTVTSEGSTIIVKIHPEFYSNYVDNKTGLSDMEAYVVGLKRDVIQEVLAVEAAVKNPPQPYSWDSVQYI